MDLFRENKKLNYKKTNDAPLGNLLFPYLKANGLLEKYLETRAIRIWHDTMGPTISGLTKKIYIKNQTIHITIQSAALRQEIGFSKDKILNFINEALEMEYLKNVQIW